MELQTTPTLKLQPLTNAFPAVEVAHSPQGKAVLFVPREQLLRLCDFLKTATSFQFDYLISVTAVDYLDFLEVIYDLHSMKTGMSIAVKVQVPRKDAVLPSVVSIWKGATLQEREVYDLMGVVFQGHPDLKRILLWDEFVGHPLRKDFGLEGGEVPEWDQVPPCYEEHKDLA